MIPQDNGKTLTEHRLDGNVPSTTFPSTTFAGSDIFVFRSSELDHGDREPSAIFLAKTSSCFLTSLPPPAEAAQPAVTRYPVTI